MSKDFFIFHLGPSEQSIFTLNASSNSTETLHISDDSVRKLIVMVVKDYIKPGNIQIVKKEFIHSAISESEIADLLHNLSV